MFPYIKVLKREYYLHYLKFSFAKCSKVTESLYFEADNVISFSVKFYPELKSLISALNNCMYLPYSDLRIQQFYQGLETYNQQQKCNDVKNRSTNMTTISISSI